MPKCVLLDWENKIERFEHLRQNKYINAFKVKKEYWYDKQEI